MTVLVKYSDMRNVFSTTGTIVADGLEEWPSAEVRSGGFTGGFTGIPKPVTAFPLTVSVDGQANGSEAYHAYLSQRTDVVADQDLAIALVSGKSGTWTISLTATGVAKLGLVLATDTVDEDQLILALRHVTLYVQRISDDAIQLVNLLEAATADA